VAQPALHKSKTTMTHRKARLWAGAFVIATATIASMSIAPPEAYAKESNTMQATHDKETVRRAFEAWAAGTGSPFDLLRDDARWTIVGHSAAAGTYANREAFMRDVIRPFNARMRSHLTPAIRRIYADGDTVIVFFDAKGIARDGVPYENTYTWYLTMRDGRITEAVAFFDSIVFDDFWKRVSPQT
jgi:ketosteroid isomerase-like protein